MIDRIRIGLLGLGMVTALLALSPAPIHAQDMNAQALYEKGQRLKGMGARALLDPEALRVRAEVEAAMAQAQVDNRRNRRFCLPRGGHGMSPKELLAAVEAVPASERRRMTSTQLVARVLEKRHPC